MTVTLQLSSRHPFFASFPGALSLVLLLLGLPLVLAGRPGLLLPFLLALVLPFVLFGPGDGHGHPVREPLFLDGRQAAQPPEILQPGAGLEEFCLQPLTFGTAYAKRGGAGHRTPVENLRSGK